MVCMIVIYVDWLCCFFCQAEDGIRVAHKGLEFRRVLFRSEGLAGSQGQPSWCRWYLGRQLPDLVGKRRTTHGEGPDQRRGQRHQVVGMPAVTIAVIRVRHYPLNATDRSPG